MIRICPLHSILMPLLGPCTPKSSGPRNHSIAYSAQGPSCDISGSPVRPACGYNLRSCLPPLSHPCPIKCPAGPVYYFPSPSLSVIFLFFPFLPSTGLFLTLVSPVLPKRIFSKRSLTPRLCAQLTNNEDFSFLPFRPLLCSPRAFPPRRGPRCCQQSRY